MRGFLSQSMLSQSKTASALLPECGACGLYRKCHTPKLPVYGEGHRRILIIGEGPSEREDTTGKQMTGASAQLLRSALHEKGIDLERDCWKTNATICHAKSGPTEKQVDYCRPNLTALLRTLQPITVIPLGGAALRSSISPYWKQAIGSLNQWVGWNIPLRPLNAWVCPTWHPQSILYALGGTAKKATAALYEKVWRLHIAAAIEYDSRPYETVPDVAKEVQAIYDPAIAARIIRKMVRLGGPVAPDFETNRIKPDAANARIVCCGLSWRGKKTIAFPWHGEAIAACRELFLSPVPKIGANIKFEQRWAMQHLGVRIRNWVHDTLLGAHIEDNRPNITDVKFQAFVQLGIPAYADHISIYLRKTNQDGTNDIHKIDVMDLLKYCAIDALVEYQIAIKQRANLGLPKL